MKWQNKKVLVTGGAGVIGRELIKKLDNLQSDILCIDREPKPFDLPKQIKYYQADISEIDIEVIIDYNPEVIFHLAASFERTEEAPEFWEINYRDNIVVSHRIIGICKRLENLEKFIYASSYLIYSPELYLFEQPLETARVLNEGDILNTRNLIGGAKYYAENEIDFISKTCGRFVSVSARIFRVYGLGSKDVISNWARRALRGDELEVYRKENMFDYVFAGDVAAGLIKLSEHCSKNEIVNLGSGKARKVDEVIKILQSYIGGIKTKDVNYGQEYEASCADISRFVSISGYQPPTTIEKGIQMVVDYEKKLFRK